MVNFPQNIEFHVAFHSHDISSGKTNATFVDYTLANKNQSTISNKMKNKLGTPLATVGVT